jgi:hypothetical protein
MYTSKRTKSLQRERIEDYKLIEEENHKLFNKLIPTHLKAGFGEFPREDKQLKVIQEESIRNPLTQQNSNRKVDERVSTKVNSPKKLVKVCRYSKITNKEWDEIGQSIIIMKSKLNEMIRREEKVKPRYAIRRDSVKNNKWNVSRESSLTKYSEIRPIVLNKKQSKYCKNNSYERVKSESKRKKTHTGDRSSHKLTIKNLKKFLHTICNSRREINESVISTSRQSSLNTSKCTSRKKCTKGHQLQPKRALYNKYRR